MYLYSFSKYNGPHRIYTILDKYPLQSGDLIHADQWYFLVLGEEISRPTLHTQVIALQSPKLLVAAFLSLRAIQLIHRMVYMYYTSYKSIVPLWVDDVEYLLKKSPTTIISQDLGDHIKLTSLHPKKKSPISQSDSLILQDHTLVHSGSLAPWSQLIVVPDVWTIHNIITRQPWLYPIATSASTALQWSKLRRWSQSGHLSTLIATPSQIFWDWRDIQQILIVDHHKRYYKNQQNPRYDTVEVCEKIAHVRWCTCIKV